MARTPVLLWFCWLLAVPRPSSSITLTLLQLALASTAACPPYGGDGVGSGLRRAVWGKERHDQNALPQLLAVKPRHSLFCPCGAPEYVRGHEAQPLSCPSGYIVLEFPLHF